MTYNPSEFKDRYDISTQMLFYDLGEGKRRYYQHTFTCKRCLWKTTLFFERLSIIAHEIIHGMPTEKLIYGALQGDDVQFRYVLESRL